MPSDSDRRPWMSACGLDPEGWEQAKRVPPIYANGVWSVQDSSDFGFWAVRCEPGAAFEVHVSTEAEIPRAMEALQAAAEAFDGHMFPDKSGTSRGQVPADHPTTCMCQRCRG